MEFLREFDNKAFLAEDFRLEVCVSWLQLKTLERLYNRDNFLFVLYLELEEIVDKL